MTAMVITIADGVGSVLLDLAVQRCLQGQGAALILMTVQ